MIGNTVLIMVRSVDAMLFTFEPLEYVLTEARLPKLGPFS